MEERRSASATVTPEEKERIQAGGAGRKRLAWTSARVPEEGSGRASAGSGISSDRTP
jgi:hypothetical protein